MALKLKTLTVAELIDLLQDQDPDARVIFSTDYGDYSRTEQALPLKGDIDEVFVEKSAYSNSGFAVVTDPELGESNESTEEFMMPADRNGKFLVIR